MKPKILSLGGGLIPVVFLSLSEQDYKTLTVRINRAKGVHEAAKMHELVKSLYEEHGMSMDEIAKEIGGNRDEIELLLKDNVFVAKRIKRHTYSKAWIPDTIPDDQLDPYLPSPANQQTEQPLES